MAAPSDPNNPYAPPRTIEAPPVIPGPMEFSGPQFAPCAHCGCTYATKVGFSWWGGIVGPALLSHVTCKRCKKKYNGKSGKSNDTAIAIYVGVSIVVGLGLFVVISLLGSAR